VVEPETSQKSVKDSAAQTKKAAQQTTVAAKATLTTAERALQISADQLVFAAERTYAAWVRTGLVSLASGLGARKLLAGFVPAWMATSTACILILFSGFCFMAGVWRHLRPGIQPPAQANVAALPTPLLILFCGFLTLVAVAALVSVVFGMSV
jgi:putative membrane protein